MSNEGWRFIEPLEASDSNAPHQITYGADTGRVSADFHVQGDDLQAQVLAIIGFNRESNPNNPEHAGKILRTLPRTFPQDPSLFANSIAVAGQGRPLVREAPTPQDASDPPAVRAQPVASRYPEYPEYRGRVEFSLRNYQVLPDYYIIGNNGIWYNDAGEEEVFEFVNEYDRFLEIDEKFDPKIITATQGQLIFRTDSRSAPDGAAFAGQPRLPLPETTITAVWRQVPYRFVSSRKSFLKRWAMRVNQHEWTIQDYYFEPGELLYLGFSYTRYTPPFPRLLQDNQLIDPFGHKPFPNSIEKWCDITLTFSRVTREVADPPQLPNRNWIANHQNALPWFGPGTVSAPARGFHYVCSFDPTNPDNRNYWQPTYLSAPLATLFMDPDYYLNNPYKAE